MQEMKKVTLDRLRRQAELYGPSEVYEVAQDVLDAAELAALAFYLRTVAKRREEKWELTRDQRDWLFARLDFPDKRMRDLLGVTAKTLRKMQQERALFSQPAGLHAGGGEELPPNVSADYLRKLVQGSKRPRKHAFQSGESREFAPDLGNGSSEAEFPPEACDTPSLEGAVA